MANQYPESLLSVHFNVFIAKSPEQVDTSSFSQAEKKHHEQTVQFETSGMGYFAIQSTKASLNCLLIVHRAYLVIKLSISAIHDWYSYC